MYLGFSNACLPELPLEQLAQWAMENDFPSLELVILPQGRGATRDETTLTAGKWNRRLVARIQRILDTTGVRIAALAYYGNLLFPDFRERLRRSTHLTRLIRLAERLDVTTVCCTLGRDPRLTLDQNVESFGTLFRPLVQCARDHGIRLAIQNDPRIGDSVEGLHGNIAIAPTLWEQIFARLSERNFGLALDVSQLVWQQIDIDAAIRNFKDRIFLLHASDIEIDPKKLGALGNTLHDGWWSHRMPGLGIINWTRTTDALKAIGYDGPIVLAHGDPVWTGTEARVKRGLALGRTHLAKFLK